MHYRSPDFEVISRSSGRAFLILPRAPPLSISPGATSCQPRPITAASTPMHHSPNQASISHSIFTHPAREASRLPKSLHTLRLFITPSTCRPAISAVAPGAQPASYTTLWPCLLWPCLLRPTSSCLLRLDLGLGPEPSIPFLYPHPHPTYLLSMTYFSREIPSIHPCELEAPPHPHRPTLEPHSRVLRTSYERPPKSI